MDERGIIIADRDADFRKQVAEHFRKAGYRVETTDSAVHVLCSVLEKQTPVLLLGSDFDKKISSADLIHLLKKSNRHLSVIMVSDEMPLAQARQVRQEGIFYHALKPVDAADTEELGRAVECAFQKHSSRRHPGRLHSALKSDGTCGAEPVQPGYALSWQVALALLVFGTSLLALAAAQAVQQGNAMAIWIFFSLCALLIMTQLLPVFRIRLPMRFRNREAAEQRDVHLDDR